MAFRNVHLLQISFSFIVQLSVGYLSPSVPTSTFLHQEQLALGVHPRTGLPTPATTIDFASIPTCALTECIYPASSATPLPCSSFPAPCPSGIGTNCSTFDSSCYCNLAKPLECAFHPCPWIDVMLMENWFNKTCPNTNFSIRYSFEDNSGEVFVPSCARNCIHEQTIRYGCTSESRNCFCSHASLYGCTATCSKKENSTIASWFAATCQFSAESAMDTVTDDTLAEWSPKGGGPSPPRPPRPLQWYEKLGIIVFSVTAGLFLIFAFGREWHDKCSYFVGTDFSSKYPRCSSWARWFGIEPAPEER